MPNPKKKINESRRGKKMVCESMIDVEHLKELLCGSRFWPKLVAIVWFCT